jgi:predicted nucleic acid-binding protein
MTTVVDINVLLDVFQNRQPHYEASARVLSLVCEGRMRGIFPAHGVTTLFYLIAKHGTRPDAISAVDRVMLFFEVRCLSKSGWKLARSLRMTDFEDAVVASLASEVGASLVITRNVSDFSDSPIPAVSPTTFLSGLTASF